MMFLTRVVSSAGENVDVDGRQVASGYSEPATTTVPGTKVGGRRTAAVDL
jgi:hypothetical protein